MALLVLAMTLPSCFEKDIQTEINDYLARNYSGVLIVDKTEVVTICLGEAYELEVEDTNGIEIDLIFDTDAVFLYETRKIDVSILPMEVIDAITLHYPNYSINHDDIEQFNYAVGLTRYEVELNNGDNEVDVVFKVDGEIECEGTDDD
jgi:hypothetical protein